MGKYFGTDGIRGVANTELSPELAFRLGRLGGYVLVRNNNGNRPKVVIGRDTRISGEMLESALVAGLLSIGAVVLRLGVLPTPGVAYATKALGADAGVMISASHNPLEDNGIKFFGADGFKLSDELEAVIESLLDMKQETEQAIELAPRPTGSGIGTAQTIPNFGDRYAAFLKSTIEQPLNGLTIVLDCANGAASYLAPRIFADLGAETVVLANTPNGLNINEKCGSTHPEHIQKAVMEHNADLGLSFDGDADRLIAVDEKGNIVDGDQILYVLARYMSDRGRLNNDTVVTTVMSNLGLSHAMKNMGIEVIQSKVGDRYVMEQMIEGGYNLGGEQSGHVIMLDYATTGDGMLTAVQLANIMKSESKPLSALTSGMTKYPQLLVNVRVDNKQLLKGNKNVQEAVRMAEQRMDGAGRILIRPSGTEPLIRVMVEGPNEQLLPEVADSIKEVILSELSYSLV